MSFLDGKKLHQSTADLQPHRMAHDEICAAHGLEILPPPQKQTKQKRNVLRRVSDEQFRMLSADYNAEQKIFLPSFQSERNIWRN